MKPWLVLGYSLVSILLWGQEPISLKVTERKLQVNGKEATVFCIVQPDGTFGLTAKKGERFDVLLHNALKVPTAVHWHGVILPSDQDGAFPIAQFALYPGQSYHYQFPIVQAGTFWMHAHYSLQEQRLLSAPLIFKGEDDAQIADREIVLFLTDFSFRSPEQILAQLRCPKEKMSMNTANFLDVNYDALLTNYRTLADPDVFEVEPGSRIRLRFINGASMTNFFLFLGALKGKAIAVDGNRIEPLQGSQFELAVAERIDILIEIPKQGGAFPILAQGEGTSQQTGILIKTKNAKGVKLSEQAPHRVGALTNAQEALLHALNPLPQKPIDKSFVLALGGDMSTYTWTINGQSWPNITPLVVEKGDRVEIVFNNQDGRMSHPMHLHGHTFLVTALNGKPIRGPMRDTLLVPAHGSATIQFDADNPGTWALHCHLLYHLEAGMLTVLRYQDYIQPLDPIQHESSISH